MMHPAGILLPHANSFPLGLEVPPEKPDTSDLALPDRLPRGICFYLFMRKLGAPVGSTGKQ